jgi:hypothetical protein
MDLRNNPPLLLQHLPAPVRSFLEGSGGMVVVGVLVVLLLVVLLLVIGRLARSLSGSGRRKKKANDLEEDLEAIPAPEPRSGDQRLVAEGVPVRIRLVVLAPAGRAQTVSEGMARKILDRVLPGLGDLFDEDQPVVRIWPEQLSYEGFANTFHRNTPLPEGEDAPSRWVMLAGRAHVAGQQFLLGLGLKSKKPTSIGRRRLDSHEWPAVLRIRVKE